MARVSCGAAGCSFCVTCLPTISEADETRQVLDAAGPAQALALFGGLAGKVIAAADSQLEQHVASTRGRLWIRLVVFASIVAALLWWVLSNTHSPPGW